METKRKKKKKIMILVVGIEPLILTSIVKCSTIWAIGDQLRIQAKKDFINSTQDFIKIVAFF